MQANSGASGELFPLARGDHVQRVVAAGEALQVKARVVRIRCHGPGERGVHQEPERVGHVHPDRGGGLLGRAPQLLNLSGPVVGARVHEDLLGLTA